MNQELGPGNSEPPAFRSGQPLELEQFTRNPESKEQAHRGDHVPEVEVLEDGRRFTTRVVRPPVDQVKSPEEKKAQVAALEASHQRMADTGRPTAYSDYHNDVWDYHKLMPESGAPDSIEVASEEPTLEVAFVRHLKHVSNVVSDETTGSYHERAMHLVEDLGITDRTHVVLIASPSKVFAGSVGNPPEWVSRTESTLDPIRRVLSERGVPYLDNDFGLAGPKASDEEGPFSLLTGSIRRAFDEYQVADSAVNDEVKLQIAANRQAQRSGADHLPFPDAPTIDATVFASKVPLEKLEEKTGITEVASATVARGLAGLDTLEEYYLNPDNKPEEADKVVVIIAGHGQFCTDISEALNGATDGHHPIVFAGNGAYSIMQARNTPDGRIAEDYIIRTGERTGMKEMV
ncbi:MAG TPA: hypothetical protein VMS08_05195 [Candidatus Saccharimonadia bacterium]|nr:hypothetical protein [Candidatus Saccharimonadia bacterium]